MVSLCSVRNLLDKICFRDPFKTAWIYMQREPVEDHYGHIYHTVEKIHAKSKIKTDKKSVINCQLSAHLTLKTGTYKIITILPNIPILKGEAQLEGLIIDVTNITYILHLDFTKRSRVHPKSVEPKC